MRDLPHVATRLFGTPLLVDPRKLEAIVPAFLRRLNGDPDEMSGEPARQADMQIADGVAVIPIIGSLVRRKTAMDAWSGLTSYGDIARCLDGCLGDARVRAILLQIDTCGGEAGGCFELCDKIFQARSTKPIWAVADVDALSAGYAIAGSAQRIIAGASGSTGSIGVVAVHMEKSVQNEAIGLTYTVFRAGARKADLNSYEPLTAEAGKRLQSSMDRLRDTFVRHVARGRDGVSVAQALATEGQWYDAPEALKLGLVDQLGTFEDAYAALAAEVALPAPAMKPAAPAQPEAPLDDAKDPDKPDEPTEVGATAMDPNENVVQLDSARTEGRAAAMAEVREIHELCALAGKPLLANEFILAGKALPDVRKALIDAKAAEDAKAGELSNHPAGGVPAATAAAVSPAVVMAGWDAAFAKVHADRTAALRR